MKVIRFCLVLILFFALPARAEIAVQEVKSPGGFTAWLVEDHSIPFTALEIHFRGGTSLDPPEQRGAVNLMTSLLEEGAGQRDAQLFAETRDGLAAQFSYRASYDAVTVSAQFLTENRSRAVELLRQSLIEPRFDADAVERVRGQVLSVIDAAQKDPESIAATAFNRIAFATHPYGTSGDGTKTSVATLSRSDIIAAHKAALARDRIYIAAAGDITPGDLAALLDQLLGELPQTGAPIPPRAEWLMKPGTTVVDFPIPQSIIQFGHRGIPRDDPDFFPAYVVNQIMGGGRFSARLMTELREKRGLTYGVSTHLLPRDLAELYIGQFSSSNASAVEAMEIVRDEWRKMAENGVTEAELATTKTYLTGAYPLRFDGNGPIARILVGMQADKLPLDYIKTRNARIEAVTQADIARVARRILQPDQLHFVVVGQPERAEAETP